MSELYEGGRDNRSVPRRRKGKFGEAVMIALLRERTGWCLGRVTCSLPYEYTFNSLGFIDTTLVTDALLSDAFYLQNCPQILKEMRCLKAYMHELTVRARENKPALKNP